VSNGFTMYSEAPASRPACTSSSRPRADRMMTGICARLGDAFKRRHASSPPTRGMRMSSIITSGCSLRASSSACSPSSACMTVCPPSSSSVNTTNSRISRSSSAINIFAIFILIHRRRGNRLPRLYQRQRHCKRRPLADVRFEPHVTIMHLHHFLHDGKTEACAAHLELERVFLDALETPPDGFAVLFGDADAVIRHRDQHALGVHL